jgi:hypothetical protein
VIKILISVSRSHIDKHAGARLPRYADEDGAYTETTEQFRQRKKGRKKLRRREKVPERSTIDPDEVDIKVTKTNWLGRMEREPAPKRSRIRRVRK